MRLKIAIAMITVAFMLVPMTVQACAGADPPPTFFKDTLTAKSGSYTKKSFDFNHDEAVGVSRMGGGTVILLSDTEMQKFESGGNYTPMGTITGSDDYLDMMHLEDGKYWIVLDNREGQTEVSSKVEVSGLAMDKAGCGPEPSPFPVPGPSFELAGLALVLVAVVAMFRKRN
jgi:hypothetical protein